MTFGRDRKICGPSRAKVELSRVLIFELSEFEFLEYDELAQSWGWTRTMSVGSEYSFQ